MKIQLRLQNLTARVMQRGASSAASGAQWLRLPPVMLYPLEDVVVVRAALAGDEGIANLPRPSVASVRYLSLASEPARLGLTVTLTVRQEGDAVVEILSDPEGLPYSMHQTDSSAEGVGFSVRLGG